MANATFEAVDDPEGLIELQVRNVMQVSCTVIQVLNEEYGIQFGVDGHAEATNCHPDQLQVCVKRADKLLKNPDAVFPDSSPAVDRLCRTWSEFTQCVQDSTKRCLPPKQKLEFDKSFKDPVASMSILCTDTPFRKEYLLYAPCIKQIAIEERNCGFQYRLLIDYMSESSPNGKKICCARSKFQDCVLNKTRTTCDAELNKDAGNESLPKRNATAFAALALNKSLGTMPQQCQQIKFLDEDCPVIKTPSKGSGTTNGTAENGNNGNKPDKPPSAVFNFKKPTKKPTEKPKQDKLSENSALLMCYPSSTLILLFVLIFSYSLIM